MSAQEIESIESALNIRYIGYQEGFSSMPGFNLWISQVTGTTIGGNDINTLTVKIQQWGTK
jgi:hypothetical protein